MGADIHLVIEYDITSEFARPDGLAFMEWPRHTELFVAMGAFDHAAHRIVPCRGFPGRSSYLTQSQYALHVCPDDAVAEYANERVIGESDALAAVSSGDAHFLEQSLFSPSISNPSFAYPNWITLAEFNAVCEKFPSSPSVLSLDCRAALHLMKQMETDEVRTRLLYWFDV